MTQWIILLGAYALFVCGIFACGIAVNRRYPLWLRPITERFKMATRAQKALVGAANAAVFYLVIGSFEWLGGYLGIPAFRIIYQSPLVLLLVASIGALFAGFGSLLFVHGPNDEPHDWLVDLKKEDGSR